MSDLAAGVRAALNLVPGNSKLAKCRALGISVPTLDRWRNGVGTPNEQNLARLARLANVDQDWIRNGGQDDRELLGNDD